MPDALPVLPRTIPLDDLLPIVKQIRPYSMVADRDILFAMECVLRALSNGLPGPVVECGTWKGGTSMAMALVQKRYLGRVPKPVHMVDSFEGLPKITEKDGQAAVDFESGRWGAELDGCRVSVDDVLRWLAAVGLAAGEYVIEKGWFKDTVPPLAARLTEGISVLRLDGDWYESTLVCLENLMPLVAEGGYVLIDDYYIFDGCARAVHEYLARIDRPCRIRQVPGGNSMYFINGRFGAA